MIAIRRIDPKTGLLYILAQLLGAVLAALALKMLLPPGVTKVLAIGHPVHRRHHHPGQGDRHRGDSSPSS